MALSGWRSTKLGNIATTVTSGSRDWAKFYSDSGSKFIRMTNLPRDGIELKLNDMKYVDIDTSSTDGKRTSLQNGDILVSITAELGKIGLVPDNFGEAFINQHTALVRIDPKQSNPIFIAYLLSSRHLNHIINRMNDSGAKAGLSLPSLRAVPINIPPPSEQTKIAQILSTWDKAITTTEQLITSAEQQKKALMQQLLTGKKRLAGFSGEWRKVLLDDVSSMNSGGTPKSTISDYYDGDIPWVSIADMTTHGQFISHTKRNISQQGLENSSARIYPKNTVLYAMYASIGECSISNTELASSQAILGIQPKSSLHFIYLYYYLTSSKNRIKLQGQQGAQSNLNAGMVKNFKISLPALDEQNKITSILTAADQEINTLQQKFDYLKHEKKALMQQLLTGKRRVKIGKEL